MNREPKLVIIGVFITALTISGIALWEAYQNGKLWQRTIGLSGDAAKITECPLHNTPLEIERVTNRDMITVSYHPGFVEDLNKVKGRDFPWANTDSGNNRFGWADPKIEGYLRKYCAQCRRIETEWIKAWDEKSKQAQQVVAPDG